MTVIFWDFGKVTKKFCRIENLKFFTNLGHILKKCKCQKNVEYSEKSDKSLEIFKKGLLKNMRKFLKNWKFELRKYAVIVKYFLEINMFHVFAFSYHCTVFLWPTLLFFHRFASHERKHVRSRKGVLCTLRLIFEIFGVTFVGDNTYVVFWHGIISSGFSTQSEKF